MNEDAIKGLKPEAVWRYFAEISAVPRCSGNEKAAADWALSVAKRLGYEAERDEYNNVVIRKPATPGRERHTAVVLQGHLDMVGDKKKDKVHNFSKDPIRLVRDGDWMKADGTSLGADNGIAIGMAMAVLESKDISHPPLEVLLTTEEEVGLIGASKLKPGFVRGKILLNIDSEEEGVVTIGCAGGIDTTAEIKTETEKVKDGYEPYLLIVGGLKGGHSGMEIHKQRGNSLKIICRAIKALHDELNIMVEKISGGNKRNAIPREAEAVIYIPAGKLEEAKKTVTDVKNEILNEIRIQDPDLNISIEPVVGATIGKVFTTQFLYKIIHLFYAMPHGVLEMSKAIVGLVQTSTNFAIVNTDATKLSIQTSQRSSIESAKYYAAHQVRYLLMLADFDAKHDSEYPAWPPNPNSKLLQLFKDVYKKKTGKELKVEAIHAGLECGIIGEKYSGMDMISFGPNLKDVHTTEEKLDIGSVGRLFDFLMDVLKEIK